MCMEVSVVECHIIVNGAKEWNENHFSLTSLNLSGVRVNVICINKNFRLISYQFKMYRANYYHGIRYQIINIASTDSRTTSIK